MKATINNKLRLTIPYQDSTLSFDPIPYEGKFHELKEKAATDGLRMPTMRELFAIVSFSEIWEYEKEIWKYEKNFSHYRKIIQEGMKKSSWLAADTGVLYEKGVGFYVANNISVKYDPSKGLMGKVSVDLDKEDKKTIFIPEGKFELGDISKKDIATHPLIQALIGEDGAKQAANKYETVCIYELLDKGNPLYASINISHYKLNLVDYYFDYAPWGKCFGIDDNLDKKLL